MVVRIKEGNTYSVWNSNCYTVVLAIAKVFAAVAIFYSAPYLFYDIKVFIALEFILPVEVSLLFHCPECPSLLSIPSSR